MANSSEVAQGQLAEHTQYNDLRDDVLDSATGHNHDGTEGNPDLTPGTLEVTDTTDATSSTSAPLKTAGGLAVAKRLFVGDRTTVVVAGASASPFVQASRTTDVSTTPVTIVTPPGHGAMLLVVGKDQNVDQAFMDLLIGGGTANDPAVVQSFSTRGTPAARTYTRSGSAVQLEMAADTYNVIVTEIAGGNP